MPELTAHRERSRIVRAATPWEFGLPGDEGPAAIRFPAASPARCEPKSVYTRSKCHRIRTPWRRRCDPSSEADRSLKSGGLVEDGLIDYSRDRVARRARGMAGRSAHQVAETCQEFPAARRWPSASTGGGSRPFARARPTRPNISPAPRRTVPVRSSCLGNLCRKTRVPSGSSRVRRIREGCAIAEIATHLGQLGVFAELRERSPPRGPRWRAPPQQLPDRGFLARRKLCHRAP